MRTIIFKALFLLHSTLTSQRQNWARKRKKVGILHIKLISILVLTFEYLFQQSRRFWTKVPTTMCTMVCAGIDCKTLRVCGSLEIMISRVVDCLETCHFCDIWVFLSNSWSDDQSIFTILAVECCCPSKKPLNFVDFCSNDVTCGWNNVCCGWICWCVWLFVQKINYYHRTKSISKTLGSENESLFVFRNHHTIIYFIFMAKVNSWIATVWNWRHGFTTSLKKCY